ncbi:DUF421 domain-containing protein [Brevibacillus dissolubilis]|uniref:DUF421 domain-containing protein n=1 Tax=Brevibacillus dissolubilis TaxID=1844116 RepID=UPI001115EE96|nr:DUF421 domain-containing protein [Brevibacillus dissolubilis]
MPDWGKVIIQSIATLSYLFIITKWIGKRQVKQMTTIEYIVGITIGSIAGVAATTTERPVYQDLVALSIFGAFPMLADWLSLKSKKLRHIFQGNATILIDQGKILEKNLRKERISTEDLLETLRMQQVFRVSDVEFAVMEENGDVTVMLKSEAQPVTPKVLGIAVPALDPPKTVIMDGTVMDKELRDIGFSKAWLEYKLQERSLQVKDVFFGQVDQSGLLYLDLYEDQTATESKETKE